MSFNKNKLKTTYNSEEDSIIKDFYIPYLGEAVSYDRAVGFFSASMLTYAAQQVGWGPIQYDGELHDRATYRYFWEILQKAKLTNTPIPNDAAQAFFS